MNLRRVEAKLKSLHARKDELEKKKSAYSTQIDEELSYLNRQIQNFEKIWAQTVRLMRSIDEQMMLADELMNEGKKKSEDNVSESADSSV